MGGKERPLATITRLVFVDNSDVFKLLPCIIDPSHEVQPLRRRYPMVIDEEFYYVPGILVSACLDCRTMDIDTDTLKRIYQAIRKPEGISGGVLEDDEGFQTNNSPA